MDKASEVGKTGSDAIGKTSTGLIDGIVAKGKAMIDAFFPPEKRAKWFAKLKDFSVSNPLITAFLLTNIALTGPPLLLFAVFTITVFVVSLVAALLIGLIAALLFTVFMLLVSLFIILPTVFMTTIGATFLFLWGLGGYFVLKWFNDGETPAEAGKAIGDSLNSITGGRLTWLMDTARGTSIDKGPVGNIGQAKDGKAKDGKDKDEQEEDDEKEGLLSTEGNAT